MIKIWESMSALDRKFVFAMINYNSLSDIIKELDINNAKFQIYTKRLINIGVIDVCMY